MPHNIVLESSNVWLTAWIYCLWVTWLCTYQSCHIKFCKNFHMCDLRFVFLVKASNSNILHMSHKIVQEIFKCVTYDLWSTGKTASSLTRMMTVDVFWWILNNRRNFRLWMSNLKSASIWNYNKCGAANNSWKNVIGDFLQYGTATILIMTILDNFSCNIAKQLRTRWLG